MAHRQQVVHPPRPVTSPPPHIATVGLNLLLAIATGVAISGWVLAYTDAFPEVASLLGLGGLFAWIAFVSQIVTEETKKSLQQAVEKHLLSQRRFGLGVLAILLLFILWASCRGSLVVSTLHDLRDRTVEVRTRTSHRGWSVVGSQSLPPRSEHQFNLPTNFWGSREYNVKVSGLPAETFGIAAFRHRRVLVPYSFSRHPALLLHTSAALTATAQTGHSTLSVQTASGRPLGQVDPYRGESVWVGCDEDVEIPDNLVAGWRLQLVATATSLDAITRWLSPRAIAAEASLKPHETLVVKLVTPAGELQTLVVVTPAFPQEVSIDLPHTP
jgi:hypothetical protein